MKKQKTNGDFMGDRKYRMEKITKKITNNPYDSIIEKISLWLFMIWFIVASWIILWRIL